MDCAGGFFLGLTISHLGSLAFMGVLVFLTNREYKSEVIELRTEVPA